MSTRNLALRHTIRKATIKDCGLINRLAWKAFPPTYQAILTPEQIEYMMHWMYDEASLRRQMTKEGHVLLFMWRESRSVMCLCGRRMPECSIWRKFMFCLIFRGAIVEVPCSAMPWRM